MCVLVLPSFHIQIAKYENIFANLSNSKKFSPLIIIGCVLGVKTKVNV